MKKMILILTGFAVLVGGAVCSNYLFAQGGAAAQPQPGTKVAVVNIGYVFNQYERAKAFKQDLERTLDPFKTKAKKLTEEIEGWTKQMRDPSFKKEHQAHYEAAIIKNQRELQDMERTIKDLLGKKQETNLITLWKEVNMGIKAVAEAYGYQVVFGYGDPVEKELLDQFPNINRKMQAMDLGSTVPLYVHPRVDLSKAVADTLNRWVGPQDAKTVNGTQTSNPK